MQLRPDIRPDEIAARLKRFARRPSSWRVVSALALATIWTGVETRDADAFPLPVAAVVDGVAEGVAKTVENRVDQAVAQNAGGGRHLGFDTNSYPGDNAMRRWKEVEHYDWVGYYLPAPCHKDPSWAGKRERLEQMGWGVAVVYVGQQYWPAPARTVRTTRAKAKPTAKRAAPKRAPSHKTPAKKKSTTATKKRAKRAGLGVGLPVPSVDALAFVLAQVGASVAPAATPQGNTWDCQSDMLTAAEGEREGRDAVARAAAEGFPQGTIVYLDIERMETVPDAMRAYYKGWTQAVLESHQYVPGFYAHDHNAKEVFDDVKPLFVAMGVNADPKFWIASGRNFNKGKAPTDVGREFAAIWQGVLDISEVWNGVKLPIDINVADRQNPSAPVVGD